MKIMDLITSHYGGINYQFQFQINFCLNNLSVYSTKLMRTSSTRGSNIFPQQFPSEYRNTFFISLKNINLFVSFELDKLNPIRQFSSPRQTLWNISEYQNKIFYTHPFKSAKLYVTSCKRRNKVLAPLTN